MTAKLANLISALGMAAAALSLSARAQDRFPPPGNGSAPATAVTRQLPAPPVTPGGPAAPAANRGGQKSAPPAAQIEPRQFTAATAAESEDFSVKPLAQLRGAPHHAPTPTQIPGGAVITTEGLYTLTQAQDTPYIIFDVLGAERCLPGAQNAQPAGSEGTFTDSVQRNFGQYLQQVTRGKKDVALIFYCQSVQCWRSYNAALRAINLGFTRVYWYRGGIDAWTLAGLPTAARQP